MTTDENVERDERTIAVENASFGGGYAFLLIALLVDVTYRGLFRNEAAWDLLGLVIVSSGFSMIYQARHRIWGPRFLWRMTLVAFVTAIVAATIAVILTIMKFR
jgi:hypothetical protein